MIYKQETIAEILNDDHSLQAVLHRFGISSQHADKSLEQAAVESGNNVDLIVGILAAFQHLRVDNLEVFSKIDLKDLIHYLQNTHVHYLRKVIPEIEQSVEQLLNDCEIDTQQFLAIVDLTLHFRKDLIEHIKEEEQDLFPYIQHLIKLSENKPSTLVDQYSIETFVHHHHHDETDLELILASILNKSEQKPLTPFSVLINQLVDFKRDLDIHTVLEDKILLPRAIQLEKEVKNIA